MFKSNEKTILIFIGIPASGKTSFYNHYYKNDYKHINLDTLKTRYQENLVLNEYLKDNVNLVIDNTNISKEERKKYITAGKENNYKIIGYYFKSSINECIERNEKRENKIPRTAVANKFNNLELPSLNEGFDELYYVSIENSEFKIECWNDDITTEVTK